MKFSQTLGVYKKEIDKRLEKYFEVAILDANKKDPLIAEALEHTKKIALAGGKRIRGALLMTSYYGFGGTEKKKILEVATAIELMHLYLLMHDDVIDRGELRHGQKTLHEMLSKKYAKRGMSQQAKHFGDSMAIIVGDLLYAHAVEMILQAGFQADLTTNALIELQKILTTTIAGQSQDIWIAYNDIASLEQVSRMYENKTAKYTFEGPLHMGTILAGHTDKKTMRSLSAFSLPLGIAFQIQDDILGVFGEQLSVGKSISSDIEEGKKTLMVIKALGKSNDQQKRQLKSILGKQGLKQIDVEKFKKIIVSTGALDFCEELINDCFKKGKTEIEKIVMLPKQKMFLADMIKYLEGRNA